MNFSSIYMNFVFCISFTSPKYFINFLFWKTSFTFYVIVYCVGAGITNLMSIFEGSDPYLFRRKMEKTRSVQEEMDGEVFISRQSRHFSFINNMVKVLFPICTLIWRVNKYDSRQGKGINRRNESFFIII